MTKWEEDDLDLFNQEPLDLSEMPDEEIDTAYHPRELEEQDEEDDVIVLCPSCGDDLSENTPENNALHLVGLCPTNEEKKVDEANNEIMQQFVFLKDDIKFRDETPDVTVVEDQQDASVGNLVPLETPATPKKRGRPKKIKVLPEEVLSSAGEEAEAAFEATYGRLKTLGMDQIRSDRPTIENPRVDLSFYDGEEGQQIWVSLSGPYKRVKPLYDALMEMIARESTA